MIDIKPFPYTGSSYSNILTGLSTLGDQSYLDIFKSEDIEALKELEKFYRQVAWDYKQSYIALGRYFLNENNVD